MLNVGLRCSSTLNKFYVFPLLAGVLRNHIQNSQITAVEFVFPTPNICIDWSLTVTLGLAGINVSVGRSYG